MNFFQKNIIFFILFFWSSIDTLPTFNSNPKAIETPLVPTENYIKFLTVDPDQKDLYVVFWKIENDTITFEVHCKNTGWVGIGISPSGGMRGADIAIGWVDLEGKGHLKDTYASESETMPLTDKVNDLTLLDAKEINGYTIFKFTRKLKPCDTKEDVEIKSGTSYLIFAWHPQDPKTGENDWMYHTSDRRRTKTVLLIDNKNELNNVLPNDTFTVDLKTRNYYVPHKRTTYYCDIFKMPTFETDVHLIQFEIIIEKKNIDLVHHVIVYECTHDFHLMDEEVENVGQECGPVKLPNHITQKCRSKMLVIWGVGGNYNNTFPEIAGYPIFKRETSHQYYLVEMHYDNPKFDTNRYDNTIVRFYYTKQLRKYELGLMGLGTDPGSEHLNIILPPKAEEVKFTSFCYSECTEKFIPDDGIYAVSSLLHTHLAGRSVRTSLVRKDKVIGHIFDNPKYDFNFQYIVDIEPLKLQKGDVFITECVYNTMDRDNFTLWGYSTFEEMCGSFFYYYPRIASMDICSSQFTYKSLYDFHRNLMKDKLIPHVDLNDNEVDISNENIMEMLYSNETVISNELIQRYSTFMNASNLHYASCWSVADFENAIYRKEKAYYVPKQPYQEPIDLNCIRENPINENDGNNSIKIQSNLKLFLYCITFLISSVKIAY